MVPAPPPTPVAPAPAGATISAGQVAVILNPAAQSAKAARLVQSVRSLTAGAHVAETRAAGEARRLARELAEAGWPTVVAAGGDGTVNEVVTGLLEAATPSPPALGLLPMGTMNVFAIELGLPLGNLPSCWQRIIDGRRRPVDAWLAGPHVFVQMAGVGVDAVVIRETTWQAKKSWGPLSYLSTLAHVLDRPPAEVRIQIDDGPWLTGTTVLLGNGRLYGGPLPVFPDAANDDGLLDVVLVHGHGPATFASLVADVLLGRIDHHHEGVTRRRGHHLTIEAPESVPYEVDGELAGQTPVRVTRHPSTLQVII